MENREEHEYCEVHPIIEDDKVYFEASIIRKGGKSKVVLLRSRKFKLPYARRDFIENELRLNVPFFNGFDSKHERDYREDWEREYAATIDALEEEGWQLVSWWPYSRDKSRPGGAKLRRKIQKEEGDNLASDIFQYGENVTVPELPRWPGISESELSGDVIDTERILSRFLSSVFSIRNSALSKARSWYDSEMERAKRIYEYNVSRADNVLKESLRVFLDELYPIDSVDIDLRKNQKHSRKEAEKLFWDVYNSADEDKKKYAANDISTIEEEMKSLSKVSSPSDTMWGCLLSIVVFVSSIVVAVYAKSGSCAIVVLGFVIAGGIMYLMSENEDRTKKEMIRDFASSMRNMHNQWVYAAKGELEHRTRSINEVYERFVQQVSEEFERTISESGVSNMLQEYISRANTISSPWVQVSIDTWAPSPKLLPVTRIGVLRCEDTDFSFPCLICFPADKSIMVRCAPGKTYKNALLGIQSFLLRLLTHIPPDRIRFTFIDPVGLGQNVVSFMHLADYDEQLVTSRAWSEPRHIEQRLAELTEHMEKVIQKYLRNEYATIEEYNAQAGEIAEPYRFLVVFDFPTNFSEDAARRLLSIAQNGPRCGVYAVILAEPTKEMPHGFNLADLERACTVISWNGKHFVWEDEDFRHCVLELDTPPEPELFNRILDAVGEAAKEASKVEVPFERVVPPPEQWWTGDSREGIRVPLGPAGARRLQYLELGKGTAQHALVVGRTQSGKTNLLRVLITSSALMYSPDELELYLIDFKKGVGFKGYATHALPHARVIAIESEREFGLSVLQGLNQEMRRRGDLFRSAGVDHITEYRNQTGSHMPRILLIVDEFQEFFTENDKIAQEAYQILDRLVRQGAGFGMHVLLGSQTLAGSYTLSHSTIDQMAVRIALQCSEADSRLILADDNPAARLLSRPGEAIYNDANGLVEGNHPFQVAWLPDDEREEYLKRIEEFAKEQGYRPLQRQIVFEGNAPAVVEENRPLNELLDASTWPEPSRRVSAWLGEPVAIKPPTAAHFRRQSASNLLMVGRDDEAAMGMMSAALVSLAAQHAPDAVSFYILDFSPVDAPYAELLARLAAGLPHHVQRSRRRHLPDLIGQVADEVKRRGEMEEDSLWKEPAIYLLIYGLQRARDLRPDDDMGFSFGTDGTDEEKPPSPARQFQEILREGPDLGIHTIVWCDTYTNLTRTLDRRSLREFETRVAMQMSADDSSNLIDTPAASKLGVYRAYFYSEDEARLEKFRPYGLPSDGWVSKVLRAMQR